MSTPIELNRAKAVLAAAKEGNVLEEPIPSDEDELIAKAEKVISDARKYAEEFPNNQVVNSVLFAADVVGISEGEDYVSPNGDTPQPTAQELIAEINNTDDINYVKKILEAETAGKGRKTVLSAAEDKLANWSEEIESEVVESPDGTTKINVLPGTIEAVSGPHPPSKPASPAEAQENAIAKIKADRLPVPGEIEGSTPTLPDDLAETSREALQELLTKISAYLSLATWRTSLAQIDEERADKVADSYFRKAFNDASQTAKNKEIASNTAEEDPRVVEWRGKAEASRVEYTMYRSLKEIYKGQWDTVSRTFAMREEQQRR